MTTPHKPIVRPITVQAFEILNPPGLDPIRVFLQDSTAPGQGRITIECYGKSWANFWGAMGDENILSFVHQADPDYVVSALLSGSRHSAQERAYLRRIVTVVQSSLPMMAAPLTAVRTAPLPDLLRLIDETWMAATESESVPSMEWGMKLIAKAGFQAKKNGCAACDRGDFQLGHADSCPKAQQWKQSENGRRWDLKTPLFTMGVIGDETEWLIWNPPFLQRAADEHLGTRIFPDADSAKKACEDLAKRIMNESLDAIP